MIPHAKFLAAVESCIGTPVKHMGRIPGKALDCVGLVWAAVRLCGVSLPPTRSYRRLPSAGELYAGLSEHCDVVSDPSKAHLLQVMAGGEARHVVVPVGFNETGHRVVVHAYGKHAVVQKAMLVEPVIWSWRIRGVG